MILPALVAYYDRMAADEDSGIAPFGYSRQKIAFEIVIRPNGALAAIRDARVEEKKRKIPKLLIVPGQAKPSGSGINPCFLWDNTSYLLGFKPDDPKPERTRESFEKFRDQHLGREAEIKDESYSAVCAFLKRWKPSDAEKHETLREVTTGFGVFRLEGASQYVHERARIKRYWEKQLSQADGGHEPTVEAPSLLSGEVQPIARLHEPKIKGVLGAQSSGAALVSFNLDAFESYDKSQSYNAPIGEQEAFRYCTALDRLTSDPAHRRFVGDMTLVFWADRPAPFEGVFASLIEETGQEDAATLTAVRQFTSNLRQGLPASIEADASAAFYVLGLSPNAARLSVRHWTISTVVAMERQLARHAADLEMGYAPPDAPPLTIKRMLDETARERKEVRPVLAGAVLDAVLTGGPYPMSLCTGVLTRIRVDGRVNHSRASVLKAFITRKARAAGQSKEIPVSLNKDHPEIAYQIGRLFAALEKTQEDAYENRINSTIKDRFFGLASAAPIAVFPRILRLHAHHLNKLQHVGLRVNRERLVQEIAGRINGFPAHLPLEDQGLFFIGYYHQRQDLFTAKSDSADDTPSSKE